MVEKRPLRDIIWHCKIWHPPHSQTVASWNGNQNITHGRAHKRWKLTEAVNWRFWIQIVLPWNGMCCFEFNWLQKKTALVLHFAEAHVLPLCWNSFKLSAVSLKARFWVGSWQPLHPSIWEHWQQFLAAAWQRQAKTPAFWANWFAMVCLMSPKSMFSWMDGHDFAITADLRTHIYCKYL